MYTKTLDSGLPRSKKNGQRMPWWKDKDHPALATELENAISQGFGPQELCARLMVMELET